MTKLLALFIVGVMFLATGCGGSDDYSTTRPLNEAKTAWYVYSDETAIEDLIANRTCTTVGMSVKTATLSGKYSDSAIVTCER